ncbi:MAG: DUF4287 domain-containing protein [Phycisphaerales bacterium]|nr:DUF4287 domain-containing protein [Phycisphaerales bacterium]
MPRLQTKSPYDVHPSIKMVLNAIANMKDKTGRTLEEWTVLVKKSGPKSEKERQTWLKKQHGLGTNYAAWIVARAEGKGLENSDPNSYLKAAAKYVETMYSGPKASLRPIHDELLKLGKRMGKDVKACPCKTIVPLYRNHVFAEIKPSTRTRIDFGLALKGAKGKLPKRLIETGGLAKGDRITHRIPIASVDEIDDQVKRWLSIAYELDG